MNKLQAISNSVTAGFIWLIFDLDVLFNITASSFLFHLSMPENFGREILTVTVDPLPDASCMHKYGSV